MQTHCNPSDSDVPFFPFRMRRRQDGRYEVYGHPGGVPVYLNRDAAEVLRLANGRMPLSEIVSRIEYLYPDAGGKSTLRSQIIQLLQQFTADDLIWWRSVPVRPVPVGPPRTIFWEITAACNLRCLHCVVDAGTKLRGELSTFRCLDLVTEMADFGVEIIAFSGGEPLLHPDFSLIAGTVRDHGMSIQLSTNGTLVTPDTARWLRMLDAGVQVSLDGSTAEIHNHLRPGHDSFSRTVEGIRFLVAAGHEVTIGTVVSKINCRDIPNILALAEDLGAARFRVIPFVPKGRGAGYPNLEVSPIEMKKLTEKIHHFREMGGIPILDLEFEEMLDGQPPVGSHDISRKLGCSGAIAYGTITPDGIVLPCHFFYGVHAKTIVDAPFAKVWQSSRFLNYFRQLTGADLHGMCHECNWLNRCGGGCRARNFATGDFLGTNHSCWVAQCSSTTFNNCHS